MRVIENVITITHSEMVKCICIVDKQTIQLIIFFPLCRGWPIRRASRAVEVRLVYIISNIYNV